VFIWSRFGKGFLMTTETLVYQEAIRKIVGSGRYASLDIGGAPRTSTHPALRTAVRSIGPDPVAVTSRLRAAVRVVPVMTLTLFSITAGQGQAGCLPGKPPSAARAAYSVATSWACNQRDGVPRADFVVGDGGLPSGRRGRAPGVLRMAAEVFGEPMQHRC
jgi:hypothetical protein